MRAKKPKKVTYHLDAIVRLRLFGEDRCSHAVSVTASGESKDSAQKACWRKAQRLLRSEIHPDLTFRARGFRFEKVTTPTTQELGV